MFEQHRRHSSRLLAKARGDALCDLLLQNVHLFVPTTKEWITTDIAIADGTVVGWGARDARATIDLDGASATPGFIDAHMHIESTKLWIPHFVAAVLPWGTTAVANDPHEMANVLGSTGVMAMIEATRGLPFTFGFSASSCVPASQFESPGARFDLDDIQQVLADTNGIGLAEVMNFPAVIAGHPELLAKITAAGVHRVDGHAPGVTGRLLDAYLCAGIESDHEMLTYDEVVEKRRKGMWVFLRHGSASQNLASFARTVIDHGTSRVALCSDDREPDLIVDHGHINHCIEVAIEAGISLEDALTMATMNAADYHGFDHLGIVAPGYQADLNIYESMDRLVPEMVIQHGDVVARHGRLVAPIDHVKPLPVLLGTVHLKESLTADSFKIDVSPGQSVRVIQVFEHSLLTGSEIVTIAEDDSTLNQLTVIERHLGTGRRGHGYLKGFGLARGAIASTVAHDAHNLMVVGAKSDQGRHDMAVAANHIASTGGGQAVCLNGDILAEVRLPIAGLMADLPAEELGRQVAYAQNVVRQVLGSSLDAPFMTLSFLGLSVIPALKLTDQGLIDVERFAVTQLIVD
ncbi:adenine deaminase [Ferrimicrobium acidiphilum]|uniref:adenine deaminase n=1 Tax=Ferrimicrobium acidiphilum TaxID=121039 RepID=UPI0023F07219|nr:adenine deaminase [Ferrimicrobium acidiphilum]